MYVWNDVVDINICMFVYIDIFMLYRNIYVYIDSCSVLSINEYTPFEKYHFKQYLNEHKNYFQNVEYI